MSLLSASVDVMPMIDDITRMVSSCLATGKMTAGGKVSHLLYYELSPEERKLFHQRLDGYEFSGTPYKLEWNPEVQYFEIKPA